MPFEPGQSGNPGGRPKTAKEFRDALMVALKRTDGDKVKLAQVAEALVEEAIKGNVPAAKEIADRIDGKVPQGVAGPDGEGPLEVLHRIERVIVDPKGSL